MDANNKGFKLRKGETRFLLPNVNKEQRSLTSIPYMEKKQVQPSDSSYSLGKWLDDQNCEPNKRVQFSRDVTVVNRNDKSTKPNKKQVDPYFVTDDTSHFLPQINQHHILTTITDESETNDYTPAAAITESTLYRSAHIRTLSLSSISSSSSTPSRRSSFYTQNYHRRAPSIVSSIEPPSSIISSLTNKDHLSSLEFHSSLSEFDRKKLNDIRHLIPDEFEKLVPTLIKLGVVRWPKKFFENTNEQLTKKELIERYRLKTLIEKDQENVEHKRYLEDLYGGFTRKDDIYHKDYSLRETLSFQGQLSLLAAYRDQIERELNRKIQSWRSIPMQSTKTHSSEDSYSISHTSQTKPKSILTNQSIHSYSNLSSIVNDQPFERLLPDQIDNQWYRKSLVNIIEQGMNLLDRSRLLPETILPNIYSNEQTIQDTVYDIQRQDLVRGFKRWLFLWSILYTEDKCLL